MDTLSTCGFRKSSQNFFNQPNMHAIKIGILSISDQKLQ